MLRFAAVIACALVMAGCVAPPVTPGVPMKLTEAQIKAVHEGVRKGLKDPESARFGDISAVNREGDKITVCGMANAKNSFGGYTGMKPFVGFLSTSPLVFIATGYGGTETDTWVVTKTCRDFGIPMF